MRKPNFKRAFKKFKNSEDLIEFAEQDYQETKEYLLAFSEWNSGTSKIADRLARERAEYEFLYPEIAAEDSALESKDGNLYWNIKHTALEKKKQHILKLEESLKMNVQTSKESCKPASPETDADEFLNQK